MILADSQNVLVCPVLLQKIMFAGIEPTGILCSGLHYRTWLCAMKLYGEFYRKIEGKNSTSLPAFTIQFETVIMLEQAS